MDRIVRNRYDVFKSYSTQVDQIRASKFLLRTRRAPIHANIAICIQPEHVSETESICQTHRDETNRPVFGPGQ